MTAKCAYAATAACGASAPQAAFYPWLKLIVGFVLIWALIFGVGSLAQLSARRQAHGPGDRRARPAGHRHLLHGLRRAGRGLGTHPRQPRLHAARQMPTARTDVASGTSPTSSATRTAMKGLERKRELILAARAGVRQRHRGRRVREAQGQLLDGADPDSLPLLHLPHAEVQERPHEVRPGVHDHPPAGPWMLAVEALETDVKPNIDRIARQSGLPDALEKPYASWLKALVEYYTDLLAADGDSFEALVRSAYRNRTDYLLTLNRLNTVEKEFYAALKPQMAATEGAADDHRHDRIAVPAAAPRAGRTDFSLNRDPFRSERGPGRRHRPRALRRFHGRPCRAGSRFWIGPYLFMAAEDWLLAIGYPLAGG
ncbi:MAG: NF038143 family protein [Desulfobacterales bacterium]|nr:NF038143 family protein [Desulfobacterales bacterium]